jgi:hypothetical protein
MMDWWEKWICNSVVLMGLTFIAFTVARSLGCGGISEFIFSILRCFHCPLLDYPPVFSILISPTLGYSIRFDAVEVAGSMFRSEL